MLLPDDVDALRRHAERWVEESDLTELSVALECYPTHTAVLEAIQRLADLLEACITD